MFENNFISWKCSLRNEIFELENFSTFKIDYYFMDSTFARTVSDSKDFCENSW